MRKSYLEIFFNSPEVQKAITEIPKLIERSVEVKTKWVAIATIILFVGLIFTIIGFTFLVAVK